MTNWEMFFFWVMALVFGWLGGWLGGLQASNRVANRIREYSVELRRVKQNARRSLPR